MMESWLFDIIARLSRVLAQQFFEGQPNNEDALRLLEWAAKLHEIGISVAHSGFHKHTAYILKNADMPGFSKKEQDRLSLLALSQRGNLDKLKGPLFTNFTAEDVCLVMSLRLATIFYRNRSDVQLPSMQGRFSSTKFHLVLETGWRTLNPLTDAVLQEEAKQWGEWGVSLQVVEG